MGRGFFLCVLWVIKKRKKEKRVGIYVLNWIRSGKNGGFNRGKGLLYSKQMWD